MDFSAVDAVLEEAVQDGVFPGAVVLVKRAGAVVYRKAHGYRSLEPEQTPLHEDIVFDLASLTKPLATTVALMRLVAEKKVRLDDRFSRFFPNFGTYGKAPITVRQLLSHASGLPAWRPYYQELRKRKRKVGQLVTLGSRSARHFIYAQLQREKIENEPGSCAVYSDLGFMLLGALVEDMSGIGFDQYCWEKIYRPLGMLATGFINLEVLRQKRLEAMTEMMAPTERCPWRKRVLCGEVHDDNAYAMGGVAGHAGLFATIDDVDRLVTCLVECHAGAHTFLPAHILREFWTVDEAVPYSTWACGWDTPSLHGSSAGELFPPDSVGHLGFTGTSIWIDLEHKIHVIMLSNRVHPRRKNDKIQAFRPVLHNTIMQTLLEAERTAPLAAVEAPATEPEDVISSEPVPGVQDIKEEEHAAESLDTVPIPLTEVEMPTEGRAGSETEQAAEQETQKRAEMAEDASPLQAELDQPSETSPVSPAIRTTQDNPPQTSSPRAQSQSALHPFLAGYRFRTNPEFLTDEARDSESRPPAADTHAQLSRTQNEEDAADDTPSGDKVSSLAS